VLKIDSEKGEIKAGPSTFMFNAAVFF